MITPRMIPANISATFFSESAMDETLDQGLNLFHVRRS
jgi:hypothetical protein